MRWHGLSEEDVAELVSSPQEEDQDRSGRRRLTARIRGRRFRIVIALEDPELVVTVHRRGR